MGSISGEVGRVEEVDILAVYLNSFRGWGYKNGCILGTVSLINTKFEHSVAGDVPYY